MIKGLRESLGKDADKEAHASSCIPGLFHFSYFPLVKSLIFRGPVSIPVTRVSYMYWERRVGRFDTLGKLVSKCLQYVPDSENMIMHHQNGRTLAMEGRTPGGEARPPPMEGVPPCTVCRDQFPRRY